MPGLLRVQLLLESPLGPGGIHLKLLVPPTDVVPRWPFIEANGALAACPSQVDADAYFGEGKVTSVAPEVFDATIVGILRTQAVPDAVWFAGELDTAKTLRQLFKDDWSLARRRRVAVGYWERSPP